MNTYTHPRITEQPIDQPDNNGECSSCGREVENEGMDQCRDCYRDDHWEDYRDRD
jgi:hypothetical protein